MLIKVLELSIIMNSYRPVDVAFIFSNSSISSGSFVNIGGCETGDALKIYVDNRRIINILISIFEIIR